MINAINTDTVSLSSQRSLGQSQRAQETQLERLASGKRVNRAADDPAASVIIEQFAAQIAGSNQAARNLSDGISLAQTADGALSTVQDNTERIRELTVQAGNSTLSSADRAAIQSEVDALSQSSQDTLRNASFNGQALFDGGNLRFQAGANADSSSQINLSLDSLIANGGLNTTQGSIDLSSPESASAALDSIDADIEQLSGNRATLGAISSRFESAINNLQTRSDNLSAARSRTADTDYAAASSQLALETVRSNANIAVQAQANASRGQVLSLLRS